MKLDLHIHSTYSDGLFNIEQIVEKAIINNINGIAIADHDNNDSWKEIDIKKFKIPVFKAVEISTNYNNELIHILGYYLNNDSNYSELSNKLKEIQIQRKERVTKIISKLENFDIFIKYEDVLKYSDGSVSRPHIAKAILNKYPNRGYTFDNLFDSYLGNDKPAYIKMEEFNVKDAVDLLHRNNCIVVLAHPWFIKKNDYKELFLFNFDGIECDITGLIENTSQYLEFAKNNNLLVTAGSDFHGIKVQEQVGVNAIGNKYSKIFLDKINCYK